LGGNTWFDVIVVEMVSEGEDGGVGTHLFIFYPNQQLTKIQEMEERKIETPHSIT